MKYGVPQDIIVAVIGVETIYGQDAAITGLDALTTLAFEYPPRAEFFRSELENFLLLAREQQFDLLSIRGSYAARWVFRNSCRAVIASMRWISTAIEKSIC